MSARIKNTKLEKKKSSWIVLRFLPSIIFANITGYLCLKGVKISVKNVKYQECKVWKKSLIDSGTVMFDHSGKWR